MKKFILICITLLLLTGCNNKNNIEIFKLENKYYNTNEFIKVSDNDLEELINNKESFIVFTYNNYCNLKIPCDQIFEEFMNNNNISIVSIPFESFKETSLYKGIKYAPSIIIIKKGKVIDYLDAASDEDLNKYQDVDEFTNWLKTYIEFK